MPQFVVKHNGVPLTPSSGGGDDQFPLLNRVAVLPAGQTLGHYTNGEEIPFSTCTTLQEVLDLLAISVLDPSIVAPYIYSFTLTGTYYNSIVETGLVIPDLTAIAVFNTGLISPYYSGSPPYGTSPRSGAATNYAFSGKITESGPSFISTPASVTTTSGANTVTVVVSYAAGVQPLKSDGSNYLTPLSSGSLNTTIVYQGAYKVFYGASVTEHTSGTSGARSLSSFFVTSTLFVLDPGLVATDFYVYIPVSSGLSITNAVVTTTFQNVTSDYVLITSAYEIPDAGGALVTYKKYKMHIAIPYTDPALRHNITIG